LRRLARGHDRRRWAPQPACAVQRQQLRVNRIGNVLQTTGPRSLLRSQSQGRGRQSGDAGQHYGLRVLRGQERFVDVEFCRRDLFAYACEAYSRVVLQGERKSRISFAEKMLEERLCIPSIRQATQCGWVNGWAVFASAVCK
jgi:hypothetical protein